MKVKDMINNNWFKRFFGRGRNGAKSKSIEINILCEFDAVKEELGNRFVQLSYIQSNEPKELVSEYHIPEGGIPGVREVGSLVYGYSVTVGFDGIPRVRGFGNVSSLDLGAEKIGFVEDDLGEDLQKIAERAPLVDVNTTDKEVKVVMEILGVKKEDIRINAFDGSVEVTVNNPQRKYLKTIGLPTEADIETARSKYNNGILEITFNKKKK